MDAWAHSIFTLSLFAKENTRARGSEESLLLEDVLINVFNMCVMRPCYLHRHSLLCLMVYSYSSVIPNIHIHIVSGFLWLIASVCVSTHGHAALVQADVSVSGSGVSVCVHDTLVSGGPKSCRDWHELSRQLSVTSERDAVISTKVKGHWPISLKWTDLKACESGGSITVDPCFCSLSYYNIKCSVPHPAFLSAITLMWDIYLVSTSLLLLFHFLYIQWQSWFI